MNFTLKRTEIKETGVFGELFDGQGNLIAFTIEHKFPDGPIIPEGTFKAIRRMSPHFGFELFCLQNIPGHDFVEIHPGNTQADSRGCILLGAERVGDAITHSRDTFKKFMDMQVGLNEISITVE
jgi:hypothetical protein